MVELDGFAARTVEVDAGPSPQPPAAGTTIESDAIRVHARANGALTVLDKRTGQRFEHLHRLEDELDMGDLYNFCPVDGAPCPGAAAPADVRVLRTGPPVWELELRVAARAPARAGRRPAPRVRDGAAVA